MSNQLSYALESPARDVSSRFGHVPLGFSRGGSGVRDHRSGTSLRSKRLRGLKSDRWSDVEIAVLEISFFAILRWRMDCRLIDRCIDED